MMEKINGHYNRLQAFNEEGNLKSESAIIVQEVEIFSSTLSTPTTVVNNNNEIAKKRKRTDKGTFDTVNADDDEAKTNEPSGEIVLTRTTPVSITSSTLSPSTMKLPDFTEDKVQQQPRESKSGSIDRTKNTISTNSGISVNFSTMWESMKRLMGFSPECHNGGFRSIGSRSCTCPQYFEGHFCERIVCANGGSRIRVAAFGDEEICKCPNPDYIKGKHCEQVHCQNGGRLLNDGTCHCVDGWYSGQFCQYYTSSWLIAIGIPLLFIAIVIFCCFICRMDLCAFRRSPTYRTRAGDRRSNNRRRHHHQQQHNVDSPERNTRCAIGTAIDTNCHRREQIPFRQHRERNHQNVQPSQAAHLYICQNLMNDQQRQQQYMVRLEQIPVYNPNLLPIHTAVKPVEPPPPYDQVILCPPPSNNPPIYCPPQQQSTTTVVSEDENTTEADQNLIQQ